MKIIFSEKCLEYSWPGHIERPERVRKALEHLREYEVLEPKPASHQDLLTVHSREYVDWIKNAEAGSYFVNNLSRGSGWIIIDLLVGVLVNSTSDERKRYRILQNWSKTVVIKET